MAIDVYSARDKRWGITKQTTWGTAEADSAAFTQLDCEAFHINRDVQIRRSAGAAASRHLIASDVAADELGSMPSFTVRGNATQGDLDILLYAFFQAVTEGGTTPFAKTFILPASGFQPDFSVSAGAFFTIIARDPVASRSWKVKDAILRSLKLSGAAGENLKYEAEFVCRGAASFASNPSGTWTLPAKEWFNWHKWARQTVNFGGGAVTTHLTAFEISLAQEIVKVGQDATNSTFQTFGITSQDLRFSLSALKDANTQTALTNHAAGTAITVNVAQGNATAGTDDGDLDFTFTGKITDDVEITHEGTLGYKISGEMHSASAVTSPITVVMANGTDRAW